MFKGFSVMALLLTLFLSSASLALPKMWQKVGEKWVEILPVQEKRGDRLFALSFSLHYGQVAPGADKVYQLALGSAFGSQSFSTISLSGSARYTIQNDYCSGNTVGVGGLCTFQVKFSPTTKSVETAGGFVSITETSADGLSTYYGTVTYSFSGTSVDIPPDECKCDGSVIGIDSRVLGEVVPVVGAPISLHYSSRFAPEYVGSNFTFTSAFSFNFEGWTNSLHHYYNYDQQRLFLGVGEVVNKDARVIAGGNLLVVSPSGDEIYIFTPTGRHLETRTALIGALKYSFGYDGNLRLVTITDAYSNVTTFTRNGSGKITSITSPYSQVTTVGINAEGLISSITNPNSEVYSMTYKSIPQPPPTPDIKTGLLATFTKPGGQVSTLTYDANGKLIKDLGHGGNFWDLSEVSGTITNASQMNRSTVYGTGYDSNGHYGRQITEPSGLVTTQTQYVNGSTGSANSLESKTQNTTDDERYGGLHRRASESVLTINSTARTTYFWQNVVWPGGVGADLFNFSTITKTTHTSSFETVEVFTNSTKEKVTTTEEGATTTVTYDANEKPISTQVGSDTATTITYDVKGRLSTTVQGSNNLMTYAYNAAGFLQSVTNALSEVTSYIYDLAGRVTSITLPDTRVIQYSYDANGNMTGVTPPSKPLHAFTFNAFELASEYQPPALSGVAVVNTQYTYNLDKQLTQITRPTGATVAYNYNSTTGLLSDITLAGGTSAYTYQSNTDLVSRIDSADGMRSNYTYYGRYPLTEEQRKTSTNFLVGKVTRTYDYLHRQQSISVHGNATSPSLATWTTYNGDHRPTQIGNMYLTYSYPSGRLSTTTMDKISDSRTYDTYGNLSGYSAYYNPTGGSPVLLYSYSLTRDTLHRITSKTETIGGVTDVYDYTYDSAGRLTTVLKNSAAYSSYTFDTNGNRTSGTTAGVSFSSTFDDQDRQLTYGTLTFDYNANGDRTQRVTVSGTNNYTWDALGNLKSFTSGIGTLMSYGYDGRNRLVVRSAAGTVSHRFIYEDDYRILARITDAGALSQIYRYGTRINTPDAIYSGAWHRIITDHLGSVRLVVRADNGTIAQRIDYNDLGRVTADSSPGFQAYGFAGGIYLSAEGLVKFGARFYDPIVGRWLSKDPIRFEGGDTNLYGYVMSDPVNLIDPTGTTGIASCMAATYMLIGKKMSQIGSQIYALNTEIMILEKKNKCDKNTAKVNELQNRIKNLNIDLDKYKSFINTIQTLNKCANDGMPGGDLPNDPI